MTRVECCDNAGDKNDATAAHLLLHLNRNNGSNSDRKIVVAVVHDADGVLTGSCR
jgi:hypothetical protein